MRRSRGRLWCVSSGQVRRMGVWERRWPVARSKNQKHWRNPQAQQGGGDVLSELKYSTRTTKNPTRFHAVAILAFAGSSKSCDKTASKAWYKFSKQPSSQSRQTRKFSRYKSTTSPLRYHCTTPAGVSLGGGLSPHSSPAIFVVQLQPVSPCSLLAEQSTQSLRPELR